MLNSSPNFSFTGHQPPEYCELHKDTIEGYIVTFEVIQAKTTWQSAGHSDFLKLGQTFITLSESTANIHHVTMVVKAEIGDEYVADGLEVHDSTGTWGMFNYGCEENYRVMYTYILFTSIIPCLQA